MNREDTRLFVCYIPGMDLRLIDEQHTPFMYRLQDDFPSVKIRTIPTTELVPTMITGAWPHEHGIWQVSLNRDVIESWSTRILSLVPDCMTTLYQCFHHLIDQQYDLACIPWRRRRHFHLHRFKYIRLEQGDLSVGGNQKTIFEWLDGRSRYHFYRRFTDIPKLQDCLPNGEYALEFLEFYAFDLLSHWNLDRPAVIHKHLQIVDNFVKGLYRRCKRMGVKMILLADHGQEIIKSHVDLPRLLKQSGVPSKEYHHFIEVGVARIWFNTSNAFRTIIKVLQGIEGIQLYKWEELRQFNIEFKDNRYGDLYIIADHGYSFFPHDFHQPLANFYLGLMGDLQRRRIFNPRHRANHGQFPGHPSEQGFMVLLDRNHEVTIPEMQLIDFAPTVFDLMGYKIPPVMKGRPVYGPNLEGKLSK
jgi:hypothetical protein